MINLLRIFIFPRIEQDNHYNEYEEFHKAHKSSYAYTNLSAEFCQTLGVTTQAAESDRGNRD